MKLLKKSSPSAVQSIINDKYPINPQITDDILARARKQFDNILNENYALMENNRGLENKLNYLIEAIQTVESEYKLKQHIPNERIASKHKLECIHEIRKQCELIKIREEHL